MDMTSRVRFTSYGRAWADRAGTRIRKLYSEMTVSDKTVAMIGHGLDEANGLLGRIPGTNFHVTCSSSRQSEIDDKGQPSIEFNF